MSRFHDLEVYPATINPNDPLTRGWFLLLLDACARMGVQPVSKRGFHHLIFMANALAPLLGANAVDQRIVRFEKGPYYPDAQYHLDRMLGVGLVRADKVHYEQFSDGRWLEADYYVTKRGIIVTQELLELSSASELWAFLLEVVRAYADIPDEIVDRVTPRDLTYGDPLRSERTLIDFFRAADNKSLQAAESFRDLFKLPGLCNGADQIALYIAYLERFKGGWQTPVAAE